MSLLGGGIFKGMAVTLRNFVGSYFDKERLTTKSTPGAPTTSCRNTSGRYPKEEAEQLSDDHSNPLQPQLPHAAARRG